MAVAVDFDPHLENFVVFATEGRDGIRRRRVVDQDLQLTASPAQRQRLGQLGRRDADGVENVDDTGGEKLFRFLERGNGDALRAGRDLFVHHGQAFGRFDVRPEAHAEFVHAILHAPDIGLHPDDLEDGGGGVQIGKACHGRGSGASRAQ